MPRFMLKALWSSMTTAAVMLLGLTLVAGPAIADVCPAEPQNDICEGTCQNSWQTCTKYKRFYPDQSWDWACGCLPKPNPPDDPAVA